MQDPAHIEIEARLVVMGPSRENLFRAVRALPTLAGLRVGEFGLRELRDEYFDLPNEPLKQRDCALRLRTQRLQSQEIQLLTFKGPDRSEGGHCKQRLEVEGPWSAPILERVLEEVQDLGLGPFQAVPGTQAPADVLRFLGFQSIQVRRTLRDAAPLLSEARTVAELTLDHVRYQVAGQQVDHREIEVEAQGETRAEDVLAITGALQEQFPRDLLPWAWSKTALGRGLEVLAERGALAPGLEGSQLAGGFYAQLAEVLGEL